MKQAFCIAFLSTILFVDFAPGAELFVAPSGDDRAPGTKDRPLATLAGARDAVRQLKTSTSEPIQVLFRGGRYFLTEEVVFRPEDSGRPEAPVVYAAFPGEKPVFCGARAISGWQRDPSGTWTTEIPEVKQGQWYFRQLHVNGTRRPRRRLPSQGLYKVAGPADPPRRAFTFSPGQIDPQWKNRDDVEIVLLQFWSEARQRIEAIDTAKHVVRFTGEAFRPMTWSLGWYAENVWEGKSEPGQWYLDRSTGRLHYHPLPGEEIDKLQFLAPVVLRWIRLAGDYRAGKYVEHLVFRGLSFHYTAWDLDCKLGYSYPQASIELSPSKPLWADGPTTKARAPRSPRLKCRRGCWRGGVATFASRTTSLRIRGPGPFT